jgi:phosphopantetheinyl transferase (holo-ACP synthase)
MFKKLDLPFLKEFKEVELEAFTDPSWGSENADHRARIRTAIQQRINTHWNEVVLPMEVQAAGDLSKLPQFNKIFVSISHGQKLGGFAISKKPVGFDLELISRVEPVLVERVSLPDEVKFAPSPAHLWSAKEAAYKALVHFRQPKVLSDVLIGGWNENTFQLLNDKLFKAPVGLGASWSKDGYVFAAFLFR